MLKSTKYSGFLRNQEWSDLGTEKHHQRQLANLIGGQMEVSTPIGRIDIINNDLIVEVKKASTHGNKAAIGQALCYTYYYPGYIPAIALIGSPESAILREVCSNYKIMYFYFWNGLWQLSF